MATVSQFAAPRDGEASLWSACGSSPLGLPGAHQSGDSFAIRGPGDGEASSWFASDATALGLRGAPERGVSFTVRGPQGQRGLILARV